MLENCQLGTTKWSQHMGRLKQRRCGPHRIIESQECAPILPVPKELPTENIGPEPGPTFADKDCKRVFWWYLIHANQYQVGTIAKAIAIIGPLALCQDKLAPAPICRSLTSCKSNPRPPGPIQSFPQAATQSATFALSQWLRQKHPHKT